MKSFTRTETQNLMADIKAALDEVSKKHGIVINTGRVSFGETITSKITAMKIEENRYGEKIDTKEAREFVEKARRLGFEERLLNQSIQTNKGTLTITGYSERSHKYPMRYTMSGKPMKSTVAFVQQMVEDFAPEYVV